MPLGTLPRSDAPLASVEKRGGKKVRWVSTITMRYSHISAYHALDDFGHRESGKRAAVIQTQRPILLEDDARWGGDAKLRGKTVQYARACLVVERRG